jgi:hypothetical protein
VVVVVLGALLPLDAPTGDGAERHHVEGEPVEEGDAPRSTSMPAAPRRAPPPRCRPVHLEKNVRRHARRASEREPRRGPHHPERPRAPIASTLEQRGGDDLARRRILLAGRAGAGGQPAGRCFGNLSPGTPHDGATRERAPLHAARACRLQDRPGALGPPARWRLRGAPAVHDDRGQDGLPRQAPDRGRPTMPSSPTQGESGSL